MILAWELRDEKVVLLYVLPVTIRGVRLETRGYYGYYPLGRRNAEIVPTLTFCFRQQLNLSWYWTGMGKCGLSFWGVMVQSSCSGLKRLSTYLPLSEVFGRRNMCGVTISLTPHFPRTHWQKKTLVISLIEGEQRQVHAGRSLPFPRLQYRCAR
jgi:hypothetical protein